MDSETLGRVEAQRRELEESVSKLRKSLRHWQTLEIDYEGLKEEFQGLPEDTSYDECFQAAEDFKPDLVDRTELQSLFDDKQKGHKRPSQLVDTLSKRIEYVTRNISTIRKQLSDAEKKRNALLLAQDPETQDDAGLPLSEIVEELDEDGRVVSSKVQAPGIDTPNLIDVLRKAGVTDIKDGINVPKDSGQLTEVSADLSSAVSNSESSSLVPEPASTSSGTQLANESSDEDNTSLEPERLGPTNPEDDEEEAALRQEMLRYGLDEVGAIVATLDLADAGNLSFDDDEGNDYLSDYDENEDLYSGESEDEKGATKNPIISERYRRQMEALSKKHGITDLQNLGPDPVLLEDANEQLKRPTAAEAARKAAIQRDEASRSVTKLTGTEDKSGNEPRKRRKKVAFAPSLDIANESPLATVTPAANPAGGTVIERTHGNVAETTTMPPASTQTPGTKKVSRFKATRSTTPSTPMFPPPMDFPSSSASNPAPEGPPGRTISENLVERPASQTSTPVDPSDFNEEIHRREVAAEYQKLRNRKIHEQGGYVRGEEEEQQGEENHGEETALGVVLDDITSKPRKISRFKAARLKSDTSWY